MGLVRIIGEHKRKVIGIVVMIIAVAMPYSIFLLTQHEHQTTTLAASPCTVTPLLVNTCRPWLGGEASNYGGIPDNPKDQIVAHEQRIGRQLDMVHTYHKPGTNSLNSSDVYFVNRGTILEADWMPGSTFASAGSPANNGNIDKMAASIKALGSKKIIFTLWHEPENDADTNMAPCHPSGKAHAGSPAEFAAMYRYIHDRFAADGVTNVVWGINYMSFSAWDGCIKQFWPGNSYVDWIFWDPYAHGNFDNMVGRFYNVLASQSDAQHDFTSKVWGIAEWNIYWSGMTRQQQIDLYNSARTSIDNNTWPRLKAYNVFDSLDQSVASYPGSNKTLNPPLIDAGLLAAYKNYALSPHFTDGYYTTTGGGASGGGGDTTPPTVSITGPGNGATVSGSINISAKASDNVGVTKVVLVIDSTTLAIDTTNPYGVSLDTTKFGNGSHTIRATAYDAAGTASTQQVVVTIQNTQLLPPSKPTITADKSVVGKGGSVLLSWSSNGAASCVLTPGNITSSGASGSKLISNMQQTTTFTVTCSNSKGSAAASLQVTVSADPPATEPQILSFTAQPSALSAGGTSTLAWSASNVATNGCSMSPGPLTSAAATGQWQTPPLSASVSYTLTCKDATGKVVSKSVGVTVNNVAPPAPPAADASSAAPTSAPVVKSGDGQQIVNALAQDKVSSGQQVTLDPSNITDQKKVSNIARVEYYNGTKLVQSINKPPFALDSKLLPPGTYTITEKTYYLDGSESERTQDITIEKTAAITPGKSTFIITAGSIVGVGLLAVSFVIGRKLFRRRSGKGIAQLDPDLMYSQQGSTVITPQTASQTPAENASQPSLPPYPPYPPQKQ